MRRSNALDETILKHPLNFPNEVTCQVKVRSKVKIGAFRLRAVETSKLSVLGKNLPRVLLKYRARHWLSKCLILSSVQGRAAESESESESESVGVGKFGRSRSRSRSQWKIADSDSGSHALAAVWSTYLAFLFLQSASPNDYQINGSDALWYVFTSLFVIHFAI